MRKRMSATNLKWACGWLAAAVLALCWWLPLPFRSTADDGPPRIYGNPEARLGSCCGHHVRSNRLRGMVA